MRLKSLGIFLLSLLLIIVLLQFDAIANLNSIFYALSESLDWIVDWASNPHPAQTRQITLPLKHEFLNGDNSGTGAVLVPRPTARQGNGTDAKLEGASGATKGDTFWFLDDESSPSLKNPSRSAIDSNPLFSLQEMADVGDPVTNLFPEDDVDSENWEDFLEAGEADIEIPHDEPIRSKFVAPLLEELKSQIRQKSEPDQLEEMLEK